MQNNTLKLSRNSGEQYVHHYKSVVAFRGKLFGWLNFCKQSNGNLVLSSFVAALVDLSGSREAALVSS